LQSECDLRAAELALAAATSAQVPGSPLLVQSDPALPASVLLSPIPVPAPIAEPVKKPTPSAPKAEAPCDETDMRRYGEPVHTSPPTTTQNSGGRKGHRVRNQSELEVNAQHYKMQKQYKKSAGNRRKRLTDIDFEGILRLIGGCNTWQLLIYLMISAHQVPHAMFNLSVVYLTYRPDHWCKVCRRDFGIGMWRGF